MDEKIMDNPTTETDQPLGKTTIAPGVLLTIINLTALDVDGVSRMADCPGGIRWRARHTQADGICIEVEDDRVYVDVYVVVKQDYNVREVSRNIQRDVARAISKMVGMDVGHINVHIEDIDYLPDMAEA